MDDRTHPNLSAGKTDDDLGKLGHRIVFENERVRIWQMTLEPGESSDYHEHENDYVMCIVEGESIDADFQSGQSIQIPVEPGKAIFVPAGNKEVAVNRSGTRFREVLIELKD
jgi:mannose-6-phosphate isomerase-like protein (cupin superfamily)